MSEFEKPNWRSVVFTLTGWIVTFIQMAVLLAAISIWAGGFYVYNNWDFKSSYKQNYK